MKLTASVRDQDGEVMVITRENYMTKKDFKETLNRNGFTVIGRIFAEGDDETRRGDLYWNKGIRL
jgi:hypothetical protein